MTFAFPFLPSDYSPVTTTHGGSAVAQPWSFLSFLPFFLLLFTLGLLKAAIIGSVVVAILVVGNSAVITGLWPAHFLWTYYCVAKSKKLGRVLKMLVLVLLPLTLVLWPIIGIVASLLGGIGYGICAPLVATFEARGNSFREKFYHCFAVCNSCSPFTMLLKLPSCLLVCPIAVLEDVPLIMAVPLWKSPYMLLRGWKRLSEDLIGREGPFLETVCVPFAGHAIILWPLAVVAAVLGAFVLSFFLALYSGVIVHQTCHYLPVLVILLHLLVLLLKATPQYRRHMSSGSDRKRPGGNRDTNSKRGREGSHTAKLVSECSRALKWQIQQYKPMQVWNWLFKSCEVNGRILVRDGFVNLKDIGECILTADDVELTRTNGPKDKVFEWLIGPLLVMKEQIKALQLDEKEESCLRELLIGCKNEKPKEWDDTCFPSNENVKRAQLQAIIRRIQGLVASISRIGTFRRRFKNLVKVLYLETLQASAPANHMGGFLGPSYGNKNSVRREDRKDEKTTGGKEIEYSTDEISNIV